MFENPRSGRQGRKFTTNVPKILDLKLPSEQMFSENWRWVPLLYSQYISHNRNILPNLNYHMSITKSQGDPVMLYRSQVRWAQKMKPCFVTLIACVAGPRKNGHAREGHARCLPRERSFSQLRLLRSIWLRTFFSSTAAQGFQNTKWPAVLHSP